MPDLSMRTIVLGFMLTGIGFVCVGALLGIVTRRKEISLYHVLLAGSMLASYPERFVQPAWVTPIRVVNAAGVLGFLVGVLILAAAAVTGQRLN